MIPWFGKLMLRMAAFLPPLEGIRNYRDYTVNRVKQRKLCGSPHKDLFHYLVRSTFPRLCLCSTSLTLIRKKKKIDEDGILEQKPTTAEIMSDSESHPLTLM